MKTKNTKIKPILISLLLLFVVVVYWIWMLYITQQATADNTYHCQVEIKSVSLHFAPHRGSDMIKIYTNKNIYILNTGRRDEEKTKKLAETLYLTGESKSFEFIVSESMPRTHFLLLDGVWYGEQVVGIQNDTDTYWNIEDYNAFQKTERISGIIAGVFITIIAVGLEIFIWWWIVKT